MEAQMTDFVIKPMAPHLMLQRVCEGGRRRKEAGQGRRKGDTKGKRAKRMIDDIVDPDLCR
jgi:hypothetical protein